MKARSHRGPVLRVLRPAQQRDGHRGRGRAPSARPMASPRRLRGQGESHRASRRSKQVESSLLAFGSGAGTAGFNVVEVAFAEIGFDFQSVLHRTSPRDAQFALCRSNLLAQSIRQSASSPQIQLNRSGRASVRTQGLAQPLHVSDGSRRAGEAAVRSIPRIRRPASVSPTPGRGARTPDRS